MSSSRSSLLLVLALACSASGVPAGSLLQVRLQTAVSSKASQTGQSIEAVLIAPLMDGERIALPAGCVLSGVIQDVHSAESDTVTQRAALTLEFRELTAPGGFHASLIARVNQVDNARESVESDGRIIGIDASKTLTSEADRGINKLAATYAGLAGLLSAAKAAIVKPADPEIDYAEGTELTLAVDKPVALAGAPVFTGPPLVPFTPAAGFRRMVDDQPVRAFAADPPRASDLTNVLIVGTEAQLRDAFRDAGWTAASSLTRASKIETLRAVMEDRGYKEGPVSLLLMERRAPDMVFEKANNTFAKRHHLRVWRRPGTFNNLPIWLITATHDTGIDFSESDMTLTHRIDSHIDRERDKVVYDLLFTGRVKSFELAARANIPPNPSNATGDQLITDGRLAVLMLGK